MKIVKLCRSTSTILIALVTSCCLLISQSVFAGQYEGRLGASFTCPDGTHLVTVAEHWDREGNIVPAQNLCIPLWYYHARCGYYKHHHHYCSCNRLNALKDGVTYTPYK